jgi:hypothetical protein
MMGTRFFRFVILIIQDMRQKTVKEQACVQLIIAKCANAIQGTQFNIRSRFAERIEWFQQAVQALESHEPGL